MEGKLETEHLYASILFCGKRKFLRTSSLNISQEQYPPFESSNADKPGALTSLSGKHLFFATFLSRPWNAKSERLVDLNSSKSYAMGTREVPVFQYAVIAHDQRIDLRCILRSN